MKTFKERLAQGVKDALVSRGAKKGMLKANCPPMNTEGAAVWQAIQFYSNPYKVGFGHLMFMDKDNKEIYEYIKECGKHIDLTTFDESANTLRALGVM